MKEQLAYIIFLSFQRIVCGHVNTFMIMKKETPLSDLD